MSDQKFRIKFNLDSEDKELYHKYGIRAIELANDEEYVAAIKLLDKVLKQKQNVEFALVLKANYISNYVDTEIGSIDFSPEDSYCDDTLTKKLKSLTEKLKDALYLINKAIQINPSNKESMKLMSLIEKTIKKYGLFSKQVGKTKNQIINNNNSKSLQFTIICPYCQLNNEFTHTFNAKITQTRNEFICDTYQKSFVIFIGEVRAVRGLGGRFTHLVTIRLKNIEDGESVINYDSRYQGNEFRSRDIIAIGYKQIGWINKRIDSQPFYIHNYSTNIFSDKL